MGLFFSIAKCVGKEIGGEVLDKYGDDLKEIAFNTISDTVESILTGRRTIEEWAGVVIDVVDKIKDTTVAEEGYDFIGGKLKFSVSPMKSSKVIIEYELYFMDSDDNYFKKSAKSDVNKNNFVQEDINALDEAGEIVYDID